ncbi:MAG: RNA 2',3'-cyclic phosphodiesterase [Promethearchaeota archaeon]
MIRTFVAVDLKDESTISQIQEFTKELKRNQPKIKLVEPENLHVTLKFIGNIPENFAPKIYKIIDEDLNQKIFKNSKSQYVLKGVGQFRGYSVIWIKIHGDLSPLNEAKRILEEKLFRELNIKKDKRLEFQPHLTIGRLKKERVNYKTFDVFKKIIKENKDREFGPFTITKIKFKKSTLTPTGPIYTDLSY